MCSLNGMILTLDDIKRFGNNRMSQPCAMRLMDNETLTIAMSKHMQTFMIKSTLEPVSRLAGGQYYSHLMEQCA